MELEQAQKLKQEMDWKILAAITDFEAKTKCCVERINLLHVESMGRGKQTAEATGDVKLCS